nr:hypothetical protein [Tanacetum cinerariifolium]
METEEVSKRYITPYVVEGLNAYDGETNLEYKKNMISNKFVAKICLEYENYKKSYNVKGPSVAINWSLTQEELSREELEKDLYERILILNVRRPIIETLKYSDQHKKFLNSVLLDKLKLDGELKVKEEKVSEEFIKSYKASKEKNDPGVFVPPICLEGKYDFHALVDTRSKHRYHDVPIVVGSSFLHTFRAIMNTMKGTTSTFDGIVRQKFYVANVRNARMESDSDDEEEYCLKKDDMGKPIYGQNTAKYLRCNDPTNRDLTLQEALNPFKKIYLMRCWRLRYTRWENKRRYSLLKLEEMHLTSDNLSIQSCVRSSILPMNLIKSMARKTRLLTDEVLDGLSAPIYYRFLDATTLRELIGSNGRLIASDTVPGVSRVVMPRPPRLTMQDLYDRMGNMESHQSVLEKMSSRQTYNSDRYVGVFEYMAGQYNISLQGAYAPPGYDEDQQ